MRLFSIAASQIPVALWLCKGLSGLLLCCMEYTSQPCDKEKVSLYWYCDISICCEKPFCIPQTSLLGVTLPSFHLRCVLALTSWWQVYCQHLKTAVRYHCALCNAELCWSFHGTSPGCSGALLEGRLCLLGWRSWLAGCIIWAPLELEADEFCTKVTFSAFVKPC